MRRFFQAEQWLPWPVETVFAFFANPQNLPPLMPAWQRPRIEQAFLVPPPPLPGTRHDAPLAGDSSTLLLSFRPFPYSPIRLHWEARIAHFLWNQQFCDTQFRGPFLYWHHCHRVQAAPDPATGNSGTLLRDEIEFELPFGPLGALAQPLASLQLAALFRFRHRRTTQLLSAHQPAPTRETP